MMRILITTSTFPVVPDDGIPRFILDLAQALSEHAAVTVLAPDSQGAKIQEQLGAVAVRRFRYFLPAAWQRLAISQQRGMRDNLNGSLLAKIQVPLFLWRQANRTRQMLRQDGYDVLNAHWLVPQGLTAAFALRRMIPAKLVLHVHAGDVYLLQRLPFGSRIARYVVRRCALIFADGSHVRDALDDLLGYDSKAILQPMGVHADQFAQANQPSTLVTSAAQSAHLASDDRQVEEANVVEAISDTSETAPFPEGFILFVGRLVEKKGVVYLLHALQRLRQQRQGLGLLIAGYGPEQEALQEEVQRLHLESAVVFLGRQSHAQIIRLLHACRVAAVPSIIDSRGETEGMPTVVVEAMAAGVPVVGSRVNGIPDVIRHAENGWLCHEKDPGDLAAKLQMALDCERSELARAAQATAQRHDWRQVAGNYLAAINRVLACEKGATH